MIPALNMSLTAMAIKAARAPGEELSALTKANVGQPFDPYRKANDT